jgi:hypothetical protein
MKRSIFFFFALFILCSLSLQDPPRDLHLDDKITVWPEFVDSDYRQGKINLNPVFQISIYEPNAQDYFRSKKPLFLNDGKNKIALIYQELFINIPFCTQVLVKPKRPLIKNRTYKLEFESKLDLPEFQWATIDIDHYDYVRPVFKKETSFNDTILEDYLENKLNVNESDESNCGGVLELYMTPHNTIRILLSSNFEIPQIIVNNLPFNDSNNVFSYKLTLIDESGNLSSISKRGKIQLLKQYDDHIHESQGNCCKVPDGYDNYKPKSFFMDFVMLTNPLFSLFSLFILVFVILILIRYFKTRYEKNKIRKNSDMKFKDGELGS